MAIAISTIVQLAGINLDMFAGIVYFDGEKKKPISTCKNENWKIIRCAVTEVNKIDHRHSICGFDFAAATIKLKKKKEEEFPFDRIDLEFSHFKFKYIHTIII